MMQADIPPSQTIYIKNLHERIKKTELKKSLYALFSQYGRILDIVACRTEKLRGQAWVVFDDVTSATYALRNMKDFPFYDRPMKIQYAKTKSDVMSKLDGTFVPKEKRKKLEEKSEKKKREQNETTSSASPIPQPTQQNGFQAQPVKPSRQDHRAPPNNILFIQNLPHETTNDALHALFCQYPGFKEVRMVEAKPGIAFIEYGDEGQATTALEALQDFKITAKNAMEISYAKK